MHDGPRRSPRIQWLQRGGARAGLEFYTEDRLGRVAREAVARTSVLFDAKPAPLGEMPVVLAAGASGILLHEAIGHGMEADFNRTASIYADRVGKPIAKDIVSIVDDGTIPFRARQHQRRRRGQLGQTDAPGRPGTLATYLHDTISAKHYRVKPTGSGRRESFRHAPMPRMRSTYMSRRASRR